MKMLFSTAALIALGSVLGYNWYFTYDFVLVRTDKGALRGFNATSWFGAKYFTFKGIPYAKPPVGELRFKGPEEETAWVGVRDAISHGSVCPHPDIATKFLRGEEDCLFLNVFTPTLEDERLPVMVWIHGGGFLRGTANDEIYGPDYFMGSGVVLVTINYRLGALGFLSTEDDGAPGNAGLKDQVAALRWIRRNVAKFGGDPENVTIFGESAGGASVQYHTLSPMSSGLFAKAIAQSGSVLNTWALRENPAETTVRLAESLGAKDLAGDAGRALKFLKSVPYEDIVRVQEAIITPEEQRIPVVILFAPSVEKGVKSEKVFLSDSPLNILKSGNFNKVPFVTGYTSHEGYFFMNELEDLEALKAVVQDTDRYIPNEINDKQKRKDLAKSIRKFYFNDKLFAVENISDIVNLYTDTVIVTGATRAAKLHLQSTNSPTYLYKFSYDGGMNLVKFFKYMNHPGAAHGDELGYLFHHKLLLWQTPLMSASDRDVVHTMIRLWTNFAKCGNPTPPGDSLTWEPVTIDKFNYLHISGRDTRLGQNPDPERSEFWTKAYEEYSAPRLR